MVAAMGPPMSRRQLDTLAGQLRDVVTALTSGRRGRGPHWLMVSALHADLATHGVALTWADLQAAISIAVEHATLKAEGDPPSVSAWESPARWFG